MNRLRWIEREELSYRQESVARVSHRARKVLNLLNGHLTGAVDAVQYMRVCRAITDMLSDRMAAKVICGELQAIVGCALSPSDRVRLACSVAGAVEDAKRHGEVGILMSDVDAIDAVAVIRQVESKEDVTGERFVHWHLLVCNSVFAGSEVFADIALQSCRRWARQLELIGTRFRPLQWHAVGQFLDAMLIVRLEKRAGQVELQGAGMCSTVTTHNRKLAAGRSRITSACQFGADYDCGRCAIGRNECSRSIVTEITNFIKDSSSG